MVVTVLIDLLEKGAALFVVREKAKYIIRINHHKTEENRVSLFLTDQTSTKFSANADQERRTALPAEKRPRSNRN